MDRPQPAVVVAATASAFDQLGKSSEIPKITALGNVTLQDMIIKWYEFELYRAVKILLPPVPIAQSNTVTTFLARYVLTDSHKNRFDPAARPDKLKWNLCWEGMLENLKSLTSHLYTIVYSIIRS
jgi:hypothetical protein